MPATWSAEADAGYDPANSVCSGDGRRVQARIVAAPNTTFPYTKSWNLLAMPGAPTTPGFVTKGPGDGTPANVSYNFNGELSDYSQTAVMDPSGTPTWWPGFGQSQRIGDTYAEPFLICPNNDAPCTFINSGLVINNTDTCHAASTDSHHLFSANTVNGSQSGMGNIHFTSWCFGKRENWAFADVHAKNRPMATGDQNLDPWLIGLYDASDVPDNANGAEGHEAVFDQYCHVPLFRPDITHTP